MRQSWAFQILYLTFCCFSLLPQGLADDEVKLKIVAINPSETTSIKTSVEQYLPPEVTPGDIVDMQGFEIQFDTQKKAYLIRKEVELGPKEVRTIELKIRNVWLLEPEQIDAAKAKLEKRLEALKGTKYFDTGSLLYQKALDNLGRMSEEQNQALSIRQRMELYRAHQKQLDEIEANGLSLEAMRQMEEEKKTGMRTASFIISAENPSAESKKMTIRSGLPREVRTEDLIENPGFVLLYDEYKKNYILEKEDDFAPNESKKYKITIRDIWYIPFEELNFQKEQIKKLSKLFKGSPFDNYVRQQKEIILENIDEIVKLQEEVAGSVGLDDRVRAHVLNTQKFDVVKKKIRDLQELLTELPLKRKDQDLKMRIKHLVKKTADFKKLVLMAIGFQPDSPITWWLIFGIIIFLAAISVIFYVVWLKKLQENKWQKPIEKNKTKKQEPVPPLSEESEQQKANAEQSS